MNSPQRRPVFRDPFRVAVWVVLTFAATLIMGQVVVILADLTQDVRSETRAAILSFDAKIAIATAALYGFRRAGKYSPFADSRYRNWLINSPWHPGLPLPRGPIHPVWEDLVVVGVLTAVNLIGGGTSGVPIALVLSYCLPMLKPIGEAPRFVILFAWAAVVLFHEDWVVVGVLLGTVLAVTRYGLCNSLSKLPWTSGIQGEVESRAASHRATRWSVNPSPPFAPLTLVNRLVWPALLGSWVFCLVTTDPDMRTWTTHATDNLLLFACLHILTLSAIRWLIYCSRYQPPISTWGRIWTGRLIIPGYDYVLIAPLCVSFAGLAAVIALYRAGVSPSLVCSLSTCAAWYLALNLGPSRRSWQLTGAYRLAQQRRGKSPGRELNIA